MKKTFDAARRKLEATGSGYIPPDEDEGSNPGNGQASGGGEHTLWSMYFSFYACDSLTNIYYQVKSKRTAHIIVGCLI